MHERKTEVIGPVPNTLVRAENADTAGWRETFRRTLHSAIATITGPDSVNPKQAVKLKQMQPAQLEHALVQFSTEAGIAIPANSDAKFVDIIIEFIIWILSGLAGKTKKPKAKKNRRRKK